MNIGDVDLSKNEKVTTEDHQNEKQLKVLLNGHQELEDQLEQFQKTCAAHDKHQRKSSKRRYYNLALMAKVEMNTTHEELKRLFKCNTRTFLIEIITNKSHEVKAINDLIRQTENEQRCAEPNVRFTIGLALQITGDGCRIGRIRNNCSFILSLGDTMTLTTDTAYRYGSFKEIAFVINLHHYLPYIKISDEILIGHEVSGFVIKILKTAVVLRIEKFGIVSSYDLIDLPNQYYNLQAPALCDIFCKDLEMAAKLQMDFISVPHIRSLSTLKFLQHKIKSNYKFKLIGSIDLRCVARKMLDLMSIIKHLDYLWLTNLFSSDQTLNTILGQDVIPLAKNFKKSIIGSVPLERCNDFKLFENHEFLWKIDCMFIEKSSWCNKYPLIARKLLPVKNYRLAVVEHTEAVDKNLSNCKSMVDFVIHTISSIECQAIFLHSKCETIAISLSRVEIYCPVYVMLSLEDNKQEFKCLIELTKQLNLRRNLRPIPYTKEMNKYAYKPIDYGIEYVRECGCLETGDFIITLEVGRENNNEHIQLGVDEDMVLMRTIYVPPLDIGEKFQCM